MWSIGGGGGGAATGREGGGAGGTHGASEILYTRLSNNDDTENGCCTVSPGDYITCPSLKHINVLVWGRTKLLYRPRCAIFGVFTVPCCGGHDWTRAFGRSPATAGRGK